MERINTINKQLTAHTISKVSGKSPDDVVICGAYRTPLSRARKGELKDTAPETMLKVVLEALIQRTGVNPELVEDMVVGNCLQPGAGALLARAAQLMSGFPIKSATAAVNRQCSSGIEACSAIAAKIKAGIIDVGVGAGVESMSLFDMNNMVAAELISDELFDDEVARNCLLPMGLTSEVNFLFPFHKDSFFYFILIFIKILY